MCTMSLIAIRAWRLRHLATQTMRGMVQFVVAGETPQGVQEVVLVGPPVEKVFVGGVGQCLAHTSAQGLRLVSLISNGNELDGGRG